MDYDHGLDFYSEDGQDVVVVQGTSLSKLLDLLTVGQDYDSEEEVEAAEADKSLSCQDPLRVHVHDQEAHMAVFHDQDQETAHEHPD